MILVVSAITDIVALGVYFPGVIRPQVGIIDGIPVYAVSRLGQFSAAYPSQYQMVLVLYLCVLI